jgi:hypothetical protein
MKIYYNPKTLINLIIDMKKLQMQVRQSARKILLSLMIFIAGAGLHWRRETSRHSYRYGQITAAGVSVVVPGTTTGTVTDINGKFSLTIPSNAKALLFSFVGMESRKLQLAAVVFMMWNCRKAWLVSTRWW